MKPHIIASLQEKKSVIIQGAIAAAEDMAEMLAKAMSQRLAEKLGSSYDRNKIFEAMFK